MVFQKCKEVIWVGWKRINEDRQMDEEPINKTTLQQHYTLRLHFEIQ